jgi:hypothetical protein
MKQGGGLIGEVLAQREALVQACWARQHWARRPLRTTDGRSLEVDFPGWLNRGAGPDFTGARIRVGDTELRGDVEIHLAEEGWYTHGHNSDPRYQRVVLHVVAVRAARRAEPLLGGPSIAVFDATPFLNRAVMDLLGEPEDLLRRYENLPGRCGLRAAQAGPQAMAQVIAHAAEMRARNKAQHLAPFWRAGGEEQLLFELIFQSLGYQPHAEAFRALARRYPLEMLLPAIALPPEQGRVEVLARWFGALGLLEQAAPPHPGAAPEFTTLRQRWRVLGDAPLGIPLTRAGGRPLNSPERRMVGMYHHLRTLGERGLLRGWLSFLKELDSRRDEPEFRRTALKLLERLFTAPPEEPWLSRITFTASPRRNPARLIGEGRIAIVMANAVVPFFLAYARQRHDRELEKVLYRLFLVLPAETPNRKTRFMEKRLMLLTPAPPTLRTHQGLLQIHQDFCTRFNQGCADCRFPDLIGGGTHGFPWKNRE